MYYKLRRLAVAGLTVTLAIGALFAVPAAASTHVGDDPYTSHCADHSYQADSAQIKNSMGKVIATVYNYYSTSCGTNWALMSWSDGNNGSGVSAYVKGHKFEGTNDQYFQGYPNPGSGLYFGSAQPMWTNMVEGVDVVCLLGYHASSSEGSGTVGSASNDYGCA